MVERADRKDDVLKIIRDDTSITVRNYRVGNETSESKADFTIAKQYNTI